jgi:hypothetical protein
MGDEHPQQLLLLDAPLVGLYPYAVAEANARLEEWGHRLGACHRPFGQQGWCLKVNGLVTSVAITASTISATVAGYHREQVVECARLCSQPGVTWTNRIMLRLWRECCAHQWPHWSIQAVVSYSHNAMHTGNLYRLDGWEKIAEQCGSAGGKMWTRVSHQNDVTAGKKTLWLYRYTQQSPL